MKLRAPENADTRRRTLRRVRQARGLTAAEAAARMGLARRTYEYFEGGDARFDLRKLELFSDRLGIDGLALLVAMMMDRPQFAIRLGEVHLLSVAVGLCAELEGRLGDRISRLDGPTVLRCLKPAFDSLEREAHSRTFRAPTGPV